MLTYTKYKYTSCNLRQPTDLSTSFPHSFDFYLCKYKPKIIKNYLPLSLSHTNTLLLSHTLSNRIRIRIRTYITVFCVANFLAAKGKIIIIIVLSNVAFSSASRLGLFEHRIAIYIQFSADLTLLSHQSGVFTQ